MTMVPVPAYGHSTPSNPLQGAIAACAANGWRLQSATPTTAVMKTGGGPGVNHVLHLLLSLALCGLWLPVWFLVAAFTNTPPERSLLVMVDDYGRVTYQNS